MECVVRELPLVESQCRDHVAILINEQVETYKRWVATLLLQLCQATAHGLDKTLEIPQLLLAAGTTPTLCALPFDPA